MNATTVKEIVIGEYRVAITEHADPMGQDSWTERYAFHVRTSRAGKGLESVGFDSARHADLYAGIVADRAKLGHQAIWS